jgi:heme/copper-type cytochrome/quinol oxidase subunit 3
LRRAGRRLDVAKGARMTISVLEDWPLETLPLDEKRGTWGMALAIVTEALLFVSVFFAYFYVGRLHRPWPAEPPQVALAIVLLVILLASSVTAWASEHLLSRGSRRAARGFLWTTIALGVVFVAVQILEYRDHLRELRPTTDAYGSLFYVITSFHGLHVAVGLLMLGFVALLPSLDPDRSPRRPLHNVVLYWHFVDVVWIFVVGLIYLLPRWSR